MSYDFYFDIKTVSIDRVALFASSKGAEIFLEKIFPHYTQIIAASADGVYPRNLDLNKKVFDSIREKEDLKLIVFNYSALKSISPKTERILVMDDLIMQDFKDHPAERLLQIGLTTEKIIFIIDNFFRQWEKMARIGNVNFAYSNFKEYNNKRFDWKRELLSNSLGSEDIK